MANRIVAFFRRERAPEEERRKDSSIGAILLVLGFITKDQLLDAITTKLRSNTEALLGEILIAQGAVTRLQLDRALTVQRERRGHTVDYVAEVKNLVAGIHARSEVVQARLDELRTAAESITRDPPKLLPSPGERSKS